jgi:hypothetical protein
MGEAFFFYEIIEIKEHLVLAQSLSPFEYIISVIEFFGGFYEA